MYKEAGITNVKDFYKEKFVDNKNFDVFKIPLAQYNISFAKYYWMFRNIKPNSRVLDFGCGSGTLTILKHKGCKITGIDFSQKALDIAKTVNGYDQIFCGSITEYNGESNSFDYIVSLDVFGHIPFEDKDEIISNLKKYLKPDGVMLHGIECGNLNYNNMSKDELKAFVKVDGHVGIENKQNTIQRFKKYFNYVDGEVRFSLENDIDEYLKQMESYNVSFDVELTRYLKSLGPKEKLAFNVANGLVQLKMEESKLKSPEDSGGFLYLSASDSPLVEPIPGCITEDHLKFMCSLGDNNVFISGWNEVEANSFRWTNGNAEMLLDFQRGGKILEIEIMSSPLASIENPQHLKFSFEGKDIWSLTLQKPGWQRHCVELKNCITGMKILNIISDTFSPYKLGISDDNRELGVAFKLINIVKI